MRSVAATVFALGSVTGCASSSGDSSAEDLELEIAYLGRAVEGGPTIVRLLDTETGEVSDLTPDHPGVTAVSWLPDGSGILFVSDVDGTHDLYRMDLDTGATVQLTDDLAVEAHAEMAPDGSGIVLLSNREPPHLQLWWLSTDGTEAMQLTDVPGYKSNPSFSPDGDRIVVQMDVPTKQIHVMDSDGSDLVNISANDHGDRYPSFSPDGDLVVFTSVRDGIPGGDPDGRRDLYVMNADGSDQRPLVVRDDHSKHADWSADGEWIAFDGAVDDVPQVFVVRSDGSEITQVTDDVRAEKPAIRPAHEGDR